MRNDMKCVRFVAFLNLAGTESKPTCAQATHVHTRTRTQTNTYTGIHTHSYSRTWSSSHTFINSLLVASDFH